MSVHTILELSTSHVTQHDAELLNRGGGDDVVALDDEGYGWFIYVGYDTFSDLTDELALTAAQKSNEVYSDAFIALARKANAEGHKWLKLDCDADVDASLPTFDW